jgi:hypothetical protein
MNLSSKYNAGKQQESGVSSQMAVLTCYTLDTCIIYSKQGRWEVFLSWASIMMRAFAFSKAQAGPWCLSKSEPRYWLPYRVLIM